MGCLSAIPPANGTDGTDGTNGILHLRYRAIGSMFIVFFQNKQKNDSSPESETQVRKEDNI